MGRRNLKEQSWRHCKRECFKYSKLKLELYQWMWKMMDLRRLGNQISNIYNQMGLKNTKKWSWNNCCLSDLTGFLPALQETWVQSLGPEYRLEKGMATHSNILAWRIPWTEESGGLQSMGCRVRHDWATNNFTLTWLGNSTIMKDEKWGVLKHW